MTVTKTGTGKSAERGDSAKTSRNSAKIGNRQRRRAEALLASFQRQTAELRYLKRFFRIPLKGWSIRFGNCADSGKVAISKRRKKAIISPWSDLPLPKDYIFHELMHVVLTAFETASKKDRIRFEEEIVRGVCAAMLYPVSRYMS